MRADSPASEMGTPQALRWLQSCRQRPTTPCVCSRMRWTAAFWRPSGLRSKRLGCSTGDHGRLQGGGSGSDWNTVAIVGMKAACAMRAKAAAKASTRRGAHDQIANPRVGQRVRVVTVVAHGEPLAVLVFVNVQQSSTVPLHAVEAVGGGVHTRPRSCAAA